MSECECAVLLVSKCWRLDWVLFFFPELASCSDTVILHPVRCLALNVMLRDHNFVAEDALDLGGTQWLGGFLFSSWAGG